MSLSRSTQVLLISAHLLWLETCSQILENLTGQLEVARTLIDYTDQELGTKLAKALYSNPNASIAIVSLDLPFNDLSLVRTLRTIGYEKAILVICSRYSVPSLQDLEENDVQSIVCSSASVEELAASLYALAAGQVEPLIKQYLYATPTLSHQQPQEHLNSREREMLQLVANDLTDQEIAGRLHVSIRTVNNSLRLIYAKLGVRGRAGAVAIGLIKGIISSHSVMRW